MLDKVQIDRLADGLITSVDLAAWLAVFEWDGAPLAQAWAGRLVLENTAFADTVEKYADRVHKWGFDHVVPANIRQHEAYSPSLLALCRSWSADARQCPGPQAVASLAALLDIRHLGIARVSKFICFLNQERYAIYDSRVSYALKELTLDGTRRVFPFIGGKQVKHTKYVLGDAIAGDAKCMAAVYVSFLGLLQRAAEKLNAAGGIREPRLQQVFGIRWTPALLEMALFMAGQKREKTPDILRLDTRLWKRGTADIPAASPKCPPALQHG